MDSKAVDRALRELFWPALKEVGFTRRKGRTAWRDRPGAIQVVNIQSFNSYLAEGLGATTYSFSINLGVFFDALAARSSIGALVADRTRPQEYHCQTRKRLMKGLAQPNVPRRAWMGLGPQRPSLGRWSDRPDVYLVLPDGSNVDATVLDGRARMLAEGLPWLDRVSDPGEAMRCFFEVPDTSARPGISSEGYGGAIGSPNRLRAIAGLAAASGDWELLRWTIDEMSRQTYFTSHPAELDMLRAELQATPTGEAG